MSGKPPELATGEPVDPESYEQRVLARTKEVLERSKAWLEREEVRDVRLEGSYPDTQVVVTMWDARNRARAREHIYTERIWRPPGWVAKHGIDPPEQTGQLIAMHALGG